MPGKLGLQAFSLRRHHKRATPHVFGTDVDGLLVAGRHRATDVHRLAMLVAHVEGHPVFYTLYQMPALRVEGHHQVILLLAGQSRLWALVHGSNVVVARLLGLAVNGQYAAVEPLPHAVVVGSHLLVVEPPGLVRAIVVVVHVEIQHPAGVGPQLVVARVKGVGQHELSA